MALPNEFFSEFDKRLSENGIDTAIEYLAESFHAQSKFHELFEALKLQLRRKLKLPLSSHQDDQGLSEEKQQSLEDGLLAACETVGNHWMAAGRPREAWMYLRAVGSKQSVAEKLRSISVTDENIEECIEVAFNETVDPAWGYQLVLQHYGTCNAITTLGGYFPALEKNDRQAVAGVLIRHVHAELHEGIVAHLAREKKPHDKNDTILKLLTDHPWLVADGNHHMDVSHLNSMLRFAEYVEEEDLLRMAHEMSLYGSRLDRELQYPGEPPFEDYFLSHEKYFGVLLGHEGADQALGYFRDQAEQVDAHQVGTQAAEVYVDLLVRSGRTDEAQAALLKHLPPGTHTTGRAPSLLELCQLRGDYSVHQTLARDNGDLLAYAIAGLETKAQAQSE